MALMRAFPRPYSQHNDSPDFTEGYPEQAGLLARDWFAGRAMEAFITVREDWSDSALQEIARAAYAMADAMLEAREK